MTTSAPYHHGNLREALVETALAMARRSGPDDVSLREVARQVGVSHNAAYRHFADREQLLAEVGRIGMDRLTAAMQERMREVPDTLDPVDRAVGRLHATGRAYVAFALDEPGLFRTAFGTGHVPDEDAPDVKDADGGPLGLLTDCLDELVDVGYIAPEDRDGGETVCWSAVHGFALLHLDGPLAPAPPAEREAALTILLGVLDGGLGSRPS